MASSSPSNAHRTVSKEHVLYSEILSVTSAMRKNSRWASSSSTHYMNARDSALGSNLGLRIATPSKDNRSYTHGGREAELMAGFQELKRTVHDTQLDFDALPLTTILGPFFAIIRSPLSTGPITSAALSALHSFFVCSIIRPEAIEIEPALAELSNTISHCKFEASDSSGDEVVLLKIMTVIMDCLCHSKVGIMLGDVEVCEMLETVLTTCCQMRLSEILRRSAENTMHSLVRSVFSRLHTLDPSTEETKLQSSGEEPGEGEIKMTVSTASISPESVEDTQAEDHQTDPSEQTIEPQIDEPLSTSTPSSQRAQFGLPSILELLRVLINVLDPSDQQHTDSTRIIALRVLTSALEESGSRILDFPSLEALIIDPGCKFFFLLARSENPTVLHLALRTITTVFDTMRIHLKLQQELFLAFTIDRLAPPIDPKAKGGVAALNKRPQAGAGSPRPGTPVTPALGPLEADVDPEKSTPNRVLVAPARGETRDLILETLKLISRHPSFMVDLYTNYDCDINCENIFERLIDFLTKSVYPLDAPYSAAQQQNVQILCLDLLLAFVNDMAVRAAGRNEEWPSVYPDAQELLQAKSKKQLVLTGAARFNTKPKIGLAFLEENKLIYWDLSPETTKAHSLASFFKSCSALDKRLLGDYISRPENIDVLTAFMRLFDFKNKHIGDAMRELLESFRLPGEAQQIARITETFASVYFASGPAEIKTEDAVYVLAYSVILLNTDLHNPQVKKRMSIEEYQRNLRGVNGGSDFTPEYLQNIYDSIRKREIVMPEEHTGQLGFDYAWKELLARSRQTGDLMMCNTPLFDMDMFKSVWKPVISAIAFAFISFDDDYIIQRAISGFRQCATLAGCFQLPDVFDFVVVSLSQATNLLSDTLPIQVPNYPVVNVEGQSITVSSLSVKFGTNFKGQLAAVVLFNIVNGNGNALREGWTQIFEMFLNLFLHSLLPTRMLQMEDFLGGVSMIPLQGSQPVRQPSRNEGAGLLSALSSYLMTPYSASSETFIPEATDIDVENTLCTIDCITSCRLDELYSQIMHLHVDALTAAVKALEALAHDRTVARLKQEPDDDLTGGSQSSQKTLGYDPASVFLLETMASIACQTSQHIEVLWPILFEHISALLSTASQYSILLIERAVVILLRLCRILAQQPSLRDQVYISFDLLAGLPRPVAHAVAEQVMSGVKLIVENHRSIIRSQTEWSLVFALIRSTMSHAEAARMSFEMVCRICEDGPEQTVVADNFVGLTAILDEFATSATQQDMSGGKNVFIERGCKAIELLFELKRFVVPFVQSSIMERHQAWRHFSLPLLSALARQSTNAVREIRYSAIGQLQRILLGSYIISEDVEYEQIEEIFNRVTFPLVDELLKPQVFKRDPQGMIETRLKASALLCKTFMHFEVRESQADADFRILWIQILDLLDRLMNDGKSDQLYEAVPESLKNVLLVMHAAGLLIPPAGDDRRNQRQRMLWTATQERLERFLPGFLSEVIPAPVPLAAPVTDVAPS